MSSEAARRARLESLLEGFSLEPRASALPTLELALTHRSSRAEHNTPGDNERLEFLGDAVIGLASAEYLFETHPECSEGDLSKLRAAMVSRKTLGEVARRMGVGELLRLGAGEEASGGRDRSSTLGSALEAICGAIWLEFGSVGFRTGLRDRVVIPALELAEASYLVDYKSRLQEWTQRMGAGVPEYRVKETSGPPHLRRFVVEVWVSGSPVAEGEGSRKQLAENEAARQALENLPKNP